MSPRCNERPTFENQCQIYLPFCIVFCRTRVLALFGAERCVYIYIYMYIYIYIYGNVSLIVGNAKAPGKNSQVNMKSRHGEDMMCNRARIVFVPRILSPRAYIRTPNSVWASRHFSPVNSRHCTPLNSVCASSPISFIFLLRKNRS